MTGPDGRTTDDLHLMTLGRLTRGALHELANPLLALVGTAEFALADAEPGTKLRERVETVHTTALEIAAIVRALQAFARQRHEPARRLSLGGAAGDAVELVRLVAAAPDVEIVARAEADPRVHESPAEVSAALVGLLLDALSAGERDGRIELVVSEDGAEAVAAARDGEVRFPRVEAVA